MQLHLPASYPLGPVQHKARLWFGDEAQLGGQRIAAAVAAAPEAPGRLKAICSQLRCARRASIARHNEARLDRLVHATAVLPPSLELQLRLPPSLPHLQPADA